MERGLPRTVGCSPTANLTMPQACQHGDHEAPRRSPWQERPPGAELVVPPSGVRSARRLRGCQRYDAERLACDPAIWTIVVGCDGSIVQPPRAARWGASRPESRLKAPFLGAAFDMRRRSPSYLPFPQKARLNGYEGDGDNCGVSFCRVVESSAHIAARKDKWHICAYYAILPLKKEIYDLLKKGRITDLDISSDSLDDFTSHQHVALYVVEIVVDKKDESC
jgi:hypothetical protein